MQPCPVVIVDDNDAARRALCDIAAATPGLELVASLGSGEDAVAFAAASTGPLLLVLDVRMPGIGGVEAARLLVEAPAGHALVLVSSDDELGQSLPPSPRLTFVPKSRVTGGALLSAWRSRLP